MRRNHLDSSSRCKFALSALTWRCLQKAENAFASTVGIFSRADLCANRDAFSSECSRARNAALESASAYLPVKSTIFQFMLHSSPSDCSVPALVEVGERRCWAALGGRSEVALKIQFALFYNWFTSYLALPGERKEFERNYCVQWTRDVASHFASCNCAANARRKSTAHASHWGTARAQSQWYASLKRVFIFFLISTFVYLQQCVSNVHAIPHAFCDEFVQKPLNIRVLKFAIVEVERVVMSLKNIIYDERNALISVRDI